MENITAPNSRMPTLFVPHGAGPCFFMDWNPADTWDRMAAFLKGIAATLPEKPRAIVLVSGHWLEPAFSLTGHARPPLIYDYSGWRSALPGCSATRASRPAWTPHGAMTMASSSRSS